MLGSKGIRPLVVLIDSASFGGGISVDPARSLLRNARIPHLVIRRDDDIGTVLNAGAH
jgi:hypothetical protein